MDVETAPAPEPSWLEDTPLDGEAAGKVHPGAGGSAVARFLIATTVSSYGDWFTVVATLVVLYNLTASLVAPAGYTLVRVLSRLLGAVPGGLLADRYSAIRIVAGGSATLAVLAVGLMGATSLRSVWLLYAVVGLSQFITSMVRPLYSAVLGQLTSGNRRGTANAISASMLSSGIFVGPALGAGLLPALGPRGLIAIDAVSYALVPLLLVNIRTAHSPRTFGQSMWTEIVAGLEVILRSRVLRLVGALHLGAGIALASAQAILVAAAAQRFGGVNRVGLLYSAVGVGSFVGGVVAVRWRASPATPRMLVTAFLVEMAGLTAFAVAHTLLSGAISLAVAGIAGVLYQTWGYTEVQRVILPGLQGRVLGTVFQGLNVGLALGALASVALLSVVAWPVILLGCVTIGTLLVLATIVAPMSRSSRRRRRSPLRRFLSTWREETL